MTNERWEGMTHDYIVSSLGELLAKIDEHGREQRSYSLYIVRDEHGDYHVKHSFDKTNSISGGSLLYGKNLLEPLKQTASMLS